MKYWLLLYSMGCAPTGSCYGLDARGLAAYPNNQCKIVKYKVRCTSDKSDCNGDSNPERCMQQKVRPRCKIDLLVENSWKPMVASG